MLRYCLIPFLRYAEGPAQTGCRAVEDPENIITVVSNDSLTSTGTGGASSSSSTSNFVQGGSLIADFLGPVLARKSSL